MAGKLISIEEAAAMLGVTPARLGELRQRGEIYGYRDGAGWKFKAEDLERYQNEKAEGPVGEAINLDAGSGIGLLGSKSGIELPVEISDSSGSVPLSGIDLDLSALDTGSGTKIGGSALGGGSEIELKLGGESGLNLLGGSGITSASQPNLKPVQGPASGLAGPPSGIDLAPTSDIMGSDVRLASLSTLGTGDAGSSNVLAGPSSAGGNDAAKTMLTAELAEKPTSSSVKMTLRDSESVFGDPGSDVSQNIQGSGINLLASSDSGLALDNLTLAPSASQLGKRKPGGSDLELKGDDDFLLTPLEEQGDESTDSGSQVIALEGDFGDDATATIMAGDVPGLGSVLEDAGGLSPLGAAGSPMGMGAPMFAAPPEPSYGIGTVAALGVSSIVLTLVGIMMYDIIRNMWSWDTPYAFNSSLMDLILSLF